MDIQRENKTRPIFIVGCTRSGTKLVSRIIGGHPNNALVTEHREKFHIPEDRSGVCEEYLWWNNCSFPLWARDGSPIIRDPQCSREDVTRLRNIYLSLAKGKRLIVKNPQNILRIRYIRQMFPDALFVFCVRNPWHGLQSRIIGGQPKYLIPSEANAKLPDDLLLRSVYSWKESIDIYEKEHDENWLAVRYEAVVGKPRETIAQIFAFIGMEPSGPYFEKAVGIPKDLEHMYYPVKRAFRKNAYQKEIMNIVHSGCKIFPYEASVESVPGSALHYYLREQKLGKKTKQLFVRVQRAVKTLMKRVLRFGFLAVGGGRKYTVGKYVFAALSFGGGTLIVLDESELASVRTAKKGEQLSFTASQMQFRRLKHYSRVVILDEKGIPLCILEHVTFSPVLPHRFRVEGKLAFKKLS